MDVWDDHILPTDPLKFDDGKPYPERLERARRNTGLTEAVQIGRGAIDKQPLALGCFAFGFMGGSMGSVVGERITRLFERAALERLPVVLLHSSGGARMQEGILSLMQMAKTVAALSRFRATRRPYISVLLHPTTGGVAASTAFLGDVNIAEPNALSARRPALIESTLRTTLPKLSGSDTCCPTAGDGSCRGRHRATLVTLLSLSSERSVSDLAQTRVALRVSTRIRAGSTLQALCALRNPEKASRRCPLPAPTRYTICAVTASLGGRTSVGMYKRPLCVSDASKSTASDRRRRWYSG